MYIGSYVRLAINNRLPYIGVIVGSKCREAHVRWKHGSYSTIPLSGLGVVDKAEYDDYDPPNCYFKNGALVAAGRRLACGYGRFVDVGSVGEIIRVDDYQCCGDDGQLKATVEFDVGGSFVSVVVHCRHLCKLLDPVDALAALNDA